MIISIVGELLHDCSWCCKTQFINRRKQQQNHSLDLEIKTVHLFPLKMHHCFVFKWGCDFHGKNNLFLCNQNERNDYHQGEFIRRAKGLFEQKTFRAEAIALPARGRQCSHCTCFYILHSIHFPSNSLQLLRRKMIACHGSWEQAVILLLMWALCREKGAATFCQRGQQHKTIKGKIWGSLRNVKNGESKKTSSEDGQGCGCVTLKPETHHKAIFRSMFRALWEMLELLSTLCTTKEIFIHFRFQEKTQSSVETLHIWRISRHLRLWCTSVLAPRQNIIWLPILFALKLSMPCIYPPTCSLSGESIRLKYSRVWRTKKRLLAEIWAKGGNTRDRSENWERTDHTVVRSVLVNTLYAIIFDFCKHCIENTYGNIFLNI